MYTTVYATHAPIASASTASTSSVHTTLLRVQHRREDAGPPDGGLASIATLAHHRRANRRRVGSSSSSSEKQTARSARPLSPRAPCPSPVKFIHARKYVCSGSGHRPEQPHWSTIRRGRGHRVTVWHTQRTALGVNVLHASPGPAAR
eukprot:scaffold1744_cov340-Prasinococcus_capsulatus_cf.AAC.8